MTVQQKISILIRKYGSKSVIRDNDSPLSGSPDSFSKNKVLPEQIWIDLKAVPFGRNPLLNDPVDLSMWPNSESPIIVKIIKKQLTWIPGTNAFYDPSDPEDPSTVVDVISPNVDLTYSPYVYVLNSQSNRYLHNISPNEYGWVFDYETGCLVFSHGIPSFMKNPEYQPPAITCYRYLGRKTAEGLATGMQVGPTGPTGPTGTTGGFNAGSIDWRGEYDPVLPYSINDAVYRDGIVWVKTTGPAGPTDFTSASFDSITYNESIDGFINVLNEQYIDSSYTSNETPYFESLDEISALLSSDLTGFGDELKNNDQNINVFSLTGAQNFYSKTFSPYSNRLFFLSPKKMTSPIEVYLEGSGYRMLSVDGLRSSNSAIVTLSMLGISRSRLSGSGTVQFIPNSTVVPDGHADVSSKIVDSLFEGRTVALSGISEVSSCDFQGCSLKIGDAGFNSPVPRGNYDAVVHYFKGCRFMDTTFEIDYTGEYPNVVIVFDRCMISDSRIDAADAGFLFPNRPFAFDLNNPNAIKIRLVLNDTSIVCDQSDFNFIDGSIMTIVGTTVFPLNIAPMQGIMAHVSGRISRDQGLNAFIQEQNLYSPTDPRATTNFYFNQ